MALAEFTPVRLTTDRFLKSEGVGRGAIGVFLEVFDTGHIVEFSWLDGTTIAWFGAGFEDVEAAPKVIGAASELPSV